MLQAVQFGFPHALMQEQRAGTYSYDDGTQYWSRNVAKFRDWLAKIDAAHLLFSREGYFFFRD